VLLSEAYLDPSRYTTDEWTTRLTQRRKNPAAKLIPVRVSPVDLHDGVWAPIIVPDLCGLLPSRAARLLVDSVRTVVDPPAGRARSAPATLPGHAGCRDAAHVPRDGPPAAIRRRGQPPSRWPPRSSPPTTRPPGSC
jgi:hypothetical protein